MKKLKSAKDIAFEKERAGYRKKIRELEDTISAFQIVIMQKENELNILHNELEQKQDWIRRLLKYTELSEMDMKVIVNKEKSIASVMKIFGDLIGQEVL